MGINFVWCLALLWVAGCATKPKSHGLEKSEKGAAAAPVSPANDLANPRLTTPAKESTGILTLKESLALALTESPELAAFSWEERAIEARVLQAGLRPNPEVSLEVEDIAGTGQFMGFRQAQRTLQLSQVIELGDKRATRTEAAAQARGVAKAEYEMKRVEVLGDVAQKFIQTVAAQHALDLALTNRQLAAATLRTVQERAKAGKASALEERKSEVALARAEVVVEGARYDLSGSRKKLSASWRNPNPVFERAEADLFVLKPLPAFDELAGRISKSPQIGRWISERKLREAELRLAETRRVPSITVGGGVRRLESSDDHAFVLSISAPWQLFDKGQGGVAEAKALLGKTDAERNATEVRLTTVLVGLYEEMARDTRIMEGLQKGILPKAQEALTLSEEGYTQGRFSYLEVLDAQRTLFDIKQEHIQTAASFHQLLVEIERLIGQPIDATESR